MKTKKRKWFLIAVTLFILLLVYLSDKIPFYHFNQTLDKTKFITRENSQSTVKQQLLWFNYSNNTIYLNANVLFDRSKIKILSLTKSGARTLSNESLLTTDDSGSILAIAPTVSADLNDDGILEKVHAAAKTDTQQTQGYVPINTMFTNNNMPFEIVLTNKSTLTLYFNGLPLTNQNVTVNTKKNSNLNLSTDENGILDSLDIREIRNGISISYQPDEKNCYNFSYQVETNSLFTQRHINAMMPLILIFLLSFLFIIIILILRNQGMIKARLRNPIISNNKRLELELHCKFLLSILKKQIKKIHITFSMVRWACMIASFIILIYGLQIWGTKINSFELPVFACPKNSDQFIGSSCYNLSHLTDLFASNKWTILSFFATTLIIIILFGRTLCGFVCPFGFLQDLIYSIRNLFKINGIPFNEKLYNMLKLFKWLMLFIFLCSCTVGINFCNFCPAIITSPAFAGFKTSIYVSGIIAIIIIVVSFFKRRFWCNLCPLGYLIGLFSKISLFKIRKNCQSCTECGACYEACPMGIKSIYTERKKEDITTHDCIMCGECVKKCPENDAISMAILKKKFYAASRFQFFNHKKKIKSIKMPFFNKEL